MNIHNSSLDKLALYGGHPVRTKPWPTYDKGNVILDDDDVSMVIDVIRSKRLYRYDNRPLHETKVGQFEIELKEYFQVQYALAVSSGTAAISLPLIALELPPNSLVGCPVYSFTATPSAIIQAQMKPLLIEVDHNLHMDLVDLERKIKQMKALVVVHMRGFPAPLLQIKEIADKHGVPIIEDSVPALGHQLLGKHLGTYGTAGAFSTQSDKSINTGEGGFILTNEKDIFTKCVILSGAYERLYEKHITAQELSFNFLSLPVFNFRLDEIHGALGLTQLKKLNTRLAVQAENYAYVMEKIQHLKYLRPRGTWSNDVLPIGDNLLLQVYGSIKDCCWFANALTKEGVDTRALGDPDNANVRRFWDWAYLSEDKTKNNLTTLYPESFKHIGSYIDLALSPTLEKDDLEDCVRAIKKVHDHYETKTSFE
jgi:dTDP-4-amino-4,6-dideoxygalactose transaminase